MRIKPGRKRPLERLKHKRNEDNIIKWFLKQYDMI